LEREKPMAGELMKSEIRNQKSEGNPKEENPKGMLEDANAPIRISDFPLSFGFLVSDFGFLRVP
jgi:hypothetical protein